MTPLEKHILKEAKRHFREIKKIFPTLDSYKSKYIEIPFCCDGVFDSIVINMETQKIESIKYSKGVGRGVSVEGLLNEFAAFFDETETKTIPVNFNLSVKN